MNPSTTALAQAIAKAEGFGPPENLSTRCNNPGDLKLGDVGCGTEAGKTIFPSPEAGWMALEHQCDLMLTGNSHVYKVSMNLLQVAQLYTGGDNAGPWAQIVSQALGVGMMTTLQQISGGNTQ